ncbi:C40 family peptidase [Brevibacillus centrosporus]|uniref:C40 family peptidase n=1 Tax=Brevibacillus centrosporus TaxID=54910 RepID=UPI0039864F62
MTKRDWMKKSAVAVILSTSLLGFGGQIGQAASDTTSLQKSEEIAKLAESLLGKDYQFKAKGPSKFGSAELATYVYKKAGVTIKSSISDLYKSGSSVSQENLLAGDLVFFSSKGSKSPNYMGVYIGKNQFVYASQAEDAVVLKNISEFDNKFVGARRILSGNVTKQESSSTPSFKSEQTVSPNDLADKIISNGEKYLGTKYKYGSSKDTTKTFDCSSFTQRVFKEAGITLPRDSRQQSTVGKSVSMKDLQKGDLIFMKASVNSSSDRITHVAIYAGNGKVLHTYGSPGVIYSKFFDTNWEKRVVKIKRVI